MLGLLYKNFAVTKVYVLLLLPACAVMVFYLGQSFGGTEYGGTQVLMVCSVYVPFCCLMDLMRKDSEFHSAVALMGAAPHTRAGMVISEYLYALALFGAAWLIFGAMAAFMPELRGVSPLAAAAVFFVLAVLIGVLLPLIHFFGYDRTRYIFAIVILLTPFLVAKAGAATTFPAQLQAADPGLTAVFWISGCLTLLLSAFLSIRAFSRADLA